MYRHKPSLWSIAIYRGASPLAMRPAGRQPALMAADLGDPAARFVADPFLVRGDDRWHLFFELVDGDRRGKIALATSRDLRAFEYRGVVLEEPFHLSYPHVFEWRGYYWMTPESVAAGTVRLYRADPFPTRWRRAGDLIAEPLADPTPFRHAGAWYLLGCPRPRANDALALYQAPRLAGPWRPHPQSPIVASCKRSARPAGRVVRWRRRPLRFAQQCEPHYGACVRGFAITALGRERYRERELSAAPILAPGGEDWHRDGMHHLDLHRLGAGDWVACVDGFRFAEAAPGRMVTS